MAWRVNILRLVFLLLLSFAPVLAGARDSRYTRHGTGPKYWIAYEYCYDLNKPMTELRWKNNIDWMAETFRDYGYDMICNDGWIEAAQTVDANGYITKYNSGWVHDFSYWNDYIESKGMKAGIYYNPLWLTRTAYAENCPVKGAGGITARQITGYHAFNGELHWVDVDKPGAEQWVKGYVRHFIDLGAKYLRIDFLENYEKNYGTERYEKALKWIAEEAGDEIFLSLVMPNCWNHGQTELKYGDMIRISDDCFEGDWDFVSGRRRGQHKDDWPQYGNVFDGMVAFSDIAGKGRLIMDGDFMRLNRLANTAERRFLFSLMIMGGSALAIADQYDTADEEIEAVYKNEELLALNEAGFSARPLTQDLNDPRSSVWVGTIGDGEFIVGFFNREDIQQEFRISFPDDLGVGQSESMMVRDLWEHNDVGVTKGSFKSVLEPHSCRILRIRQATIDEIPGFGCTGCTKN